MKPDAFLLAYQDAMDALAGGSTDEQIEALSGAVSAAYDALYPVGGSV